MKQYQFYYLSAIHQIYLLDFNSKQILSVSRDKIKDLTQKAHSNYAENKRRNELNTMKEYCISELSAYMKGEITIKDLRHNKPIFMTDSKDERDYFIYHYQLDSSIASQEEINMYMKGLPILYKVYILFWNYNKKNIPELSKEEPISLNRNEYGKIDYVYLSERQMRIIYKSEYPQSKLRIENKAA